MRQSRLYNNIIIYIDYKLIFAILLISMLSGCSTFRGIKSDKISREVYLTPVSFDRLKGWDLDNHLNAFNVFMNSCSVILKRNPNYPISTLTQLGDKSKYWQNICKAGLSQRVDTVEQARLFFEQWFVPYKVSNVEGSNLGKFTGYYEIELNGSRRKTANHKYPVYGLPKNIKILKGRSDFTHSAINRGALENKRLELAWVDSKARLFFMHIQGSGVIKLAEGGEMKVGYAGHNGFPYSSIWPVLKSHGIKHIASATSMMRWLDANPSLGLKFMEENKSYVFFREIHGKSPIGGQGIHLEAERSIALDAGIYPYGAPIWVETVLPNTQHTKHAVYNRLFIAQDTGGAIKGPIRADIFFGRGAHAEELASHMNESGTYYVFFPKFIIIPTHYRAH